MRQPAGAEITHLDASKKAVALAFDNRALSGLEDAPIRFITDDALRFVPARIGAATAMTAFCLTRRNMGAAQKVRSGIYMRIYQNCCRMPGLAVR